MKLYHGDIVYSESRKKLAVFENSYIAVDQDRVDGIYQIIPEKYKGAPVTDYGRGMIIPAFSDLHVHASQYIQRGVGMDLLLSDWLEHYTFPQESNFQDPDYARGIYEAFVKDLVRHGTFHACIFTTIHRNSANILYELMEKQGLQGLIGKVNMNCGAPDYLCESTEESLKETEIFLEEHSQKGNVRPIITPRFAPTCSWELLKGLGDLAAKYECGMQTHLVESRWEEEQARQLFPDCTCDAEIYEKAGLMDHGPVILAHYIFPGRDDLSIVKAHECLTVHCPDATTNIIAGIMQTGTLMDQGIRIALGSDIGGGHGVAVYRQAARAIQLSKLKEFYEPENNRVITLEEAFHMATAEGGSAFCNTGTFEKGRRFDALVIDGVEDAGHPMSVASRLERFFYIGDDRNIRARFVEGRELVL